MENRNIVTYIRTATNDEKAVEMQRLQVNECVAELADDVYTTTLKEVIDMGYSGLSSSRPGLENVLELCKEGEVDVLVTTEISRLDRNLSTAHQLINRLDELGVIVEFTNSPALLIEAGTDNNANFTEKILELVAEQDSKARSKRIKAGIQRKKLEGKNN